MYIDAAESCDPTLPEPRVIAPEVSDVRQTIQLCDKRSDFPFGDKAFVAPRNFDRIFKLYFNFWNKASFRISLQRLPTPWCYEDNLRTCTHGTLLHYFVLNLRYSLIHFSRLSHTAFLGPG